MAAPPGGDRRRRRGARRRHRLPRAAPWAARRLGRFRLEPPPPITPSPVPVQSPEFIRLPVGPNGIIGQHHAVGRQPAAAGLGNAAGLVLARHRPLGDDRRPACRRFRLPVHPRRRRLGGAGERDVLRRRRLLDPAEPGLVSRQRRAVGDPIGTADLVAPAVDVNALWLTSYFPTANNVTAPVAWRGRSAPPALNWRRRSGFRAPPSSTRQPIAACCWSRPAGSPGTRSTRSGTRRLGKAIRTFDNVIAASATEIAWTPGCAATCRLQVLDLATGRQTAVGLPAGSSASGASVQPGRDACSRSS